MFDFRRTMIRRRVVVALKSGRSVDGVLWAQRGPLLVLKNARVYDENDVPVPADGEIVIERSAVDFVQVATMQEG